MVFATLTEIFLFPLSLSTQGHWLNLGPDDSLSFESDEIEIGEAALRSLGHSALGVAPRSDFKTLTVEMVKRCGFKSWRQLGSSASLVTIRGAGHKLVLEPWHWDGRRSYLPSHSSQPVELVRDAASLGESLKRLLAQKQVQG